MTKLLSFAPLAALTATLAVLLSCGDPTGPLLGSVLVPGVIVDGRVEAVDRPAEYTLPVKAGDEFVVYFQSFKRGLTLRVIDPQSGQVLSTAVDWDTAGTLADARTSLVRASADGELVVRVSAPPEVDFGDFRLLVTVVPRHPEGRVAQIALNDTIRESLDTDIDVDEFTFEASANDEVVVFLQAGAAEFNRVSMRLYAPDGAAIAEVQSVDPATDFEAAGSGRILLPAAGRYRIRVDQWGRSAPLPYTFQVRRVDRRPEHAASALVSADTVDTELLDFVGDIDEFVIEGNAGDAYNIFVHSLGPASNVIRAEVVGQPNTLIEVNSRETLVGGGMGAFVLPATGRATVRIMGAYDRYGLYRGPYRILAYRIDPAPEHAPQVLVPAATVSERIELPGDIDRFSFTLGSSAAVNVLLRKPPGDGEGAQRLFVRRPGELHDLASATAYLTPLAEESNVSTGNVQLPAGTYVIEVDGYTGRKGGFVGGYELTLFRIDTMPERRSATIAIGDTVVGESIDHIGDVDVFTFSGTAGQSVYAILQPSNLNASIGVDIIHPRWGPLIQRPSNIGGPLPPIRIELPETGTYQLRVAPADTKHYRSVGEYRAAVIVARREPESVPATLALGERVTAEGTDFRGDIDEFTVAGTAGQEIAATFFSTSSLGPFMVLTVVDPASDSAIATAGGWDVGGSPHTGRFQIPASGSMVFRIAERPQCGAPGYCYHVTGPFDLRTRRIDRAPDNIAARIAVGDTAKGEAVDFPGDIDEFFFAGTAGQRVRVLFRAGNPIYNEGRLALELIHPATGAVLTSTTARLHDGLTEVVELPESRDYMIRVRGVRDNSDAAHYSFVIQTP